MIMADVLKIVLLIVGGMLVFLSHWLACHALFPKAVERSRDLYGRPVLLTMLGLVTAGPIILLGIFIAQKGGNNPLTQMIAATLFGLPVYLALFGSSGLALRIGEGLGGASDEAMWRRTLRGGVVLALTYLLPFAGWIFLTAWTLVSGAGAALLILFKKERDGGPPSEEPASESPAAKMS